MLVLGIQHHNVGEDWGHGYWHKFGRYGRLFLSSLGFSVRLQAPAPKHEPSTQDMTNAFVEQNGSPSPSDERYVSVHALSAGHFTLPEYQFIHPVSRDARKTVPSLAFLIQRQDAYSGDITRIVFDLGLRRDTKRYAAPIQKHIETRTPLSTDPDVVKSLARGGLKPNDIDYVVYSHVGFNWPVQ